MDHRYIEEHDIADRYWMGKLSSEEQQAFELHIMDCSTCLARVEESEGLREGLRSVRKAGRAPIPTAAWRIAAIAACLGLSIAGTASYVLRRQLVEARQEAAVERQQLSNRVAPKPELAAASLYRFEIVRGEQTPNRVFVPSSPESIVISLRLEPAPGATRYQVVLLAASGATVARKSDLALDAGGHLVVTFPSTLLVPGDYTLRVESLSSSGQASEIATYPFRALPRP